MLLAPLSSHQTYIAGAARSAPALRRHPTMVLELDPSAAVHSISSLLAEEGAEPITPVFLAQLGLGATMCAVAPFAPSQLWLAPGRA